MAAKKPTNRKSKTNPIDGESSPRPTSVTWRTFPGTRQRSGRGLEAHINYVLLTADRRLES